MTGGNPFSKGALIALVALLAIIAAASILLLRGSTVVDTSNSIGANSYSRSAVGYRGWFEVMRQTSGALVTRSQDEAGSRVGARGILILAEPGYGIAADDLRAKAQRSQKTLVVLPKWQIYPDRERRDWIGAAQLLPLFLPQSVLAVFTDKGDVTRSDAATLATSTVIAHQPTIAGPVQVIKNAAMTPLVSTTDGVLLGEIKTGDRRVWVLADPDVIANHGIGKGDNAALAVDMIDAFCGGCTAIVLDETIHGFTPAAPPRLMRMFDFPYVLVLGQAAVAIALLLLAAGARFGVARRPANRPQPGKLGLIKSAAALMDYGGHHAASLRRYCQVCVRDTARLLHAPAGLDDRHMLAWLDRLARARGIKADVAAILDAAASAQPGELARLFAAAHAIHAWKREMQNAAIRR